MCWFYVPSVARVRVLCGSVIGNSRMWHCCRVGTGSVPLLPCWWFYVPSCASCGRVQLFVLVCVIMLPCCCVYGGRVGVAVAVVLSYRQQSDVELWPRLSSATVCCACMVVAFHCGRCGSVVRVLWFYVASCGRCAALCVGVRGSVAVAVCGTGSVLRSQRCQLWPLPLLWFCHRQRSVVACMVIVWPLVRVVAVVVLVAFYIPSVARVRVLWFCHRQRSVVACMVVALPAVAVLPLLWFYYRQRSVVPVW